MKYFVWKQKYIKMYLECQKKTYKIIIIRRTVIKFKTLCISSLLFAILLLATVTDITVEYWQLSLSLRKSTAASK